MRNKKLFKNWRVLVAVVATIAIANLFIVTEMTGVSYAEQQGIIDYEPMAISAGVGAYRASELIGKDVRNLQDEEIGTIDDLLIKEDGTVGAAVLSVGGFLGMGARLVAVPYDELQVRKEEDDVMYPATREQLKAVPEFKYEQEGRPAQ
jgi:sporulation protein YlmC with PRC-barrel domain